MRSTVAHDRPRGHLIFRRGPISRAADARLTEGGRITLSGRLLVRTENGEREEHELATDAEVLEAYRTHFGITLDRVPEVRSFA